MALVAADRVKETTVTTGTGTYSLGGASEGFQSFSDVLSDSDTAYYGITDNTDWEVGIGTFTASGETLARTVVLSSSNSDNAVDWGSGVKYIFLTYPADKVIYKDASGSVALPTVDINGGTIDGTVIGGSSAAAGTFTTLNADGGGALTGTWTDLGSVDTIDINGGTIDGVTIGASTAGAGTFTAVTVNGNIVLTGTVDGRDVAADGSKLDGIEALADVTDTANVTAAGALMDSEVVNLPAVKAFDPADYATSAQGDLADSALQDGDTVASLDINGGTIDGTVIGGTTPAAISGTTGSFSGDFAVDTDTLFVDASTGNVGFGTSTFQEKITVAVSDNEDGLSIWNTSTAATPNKNPLLNFYATDTIGTTKVTARILAENVEMDAVNSNLLFYTRGSDSTTERMRIDSSGNLLVGMTSSSSVADGCRLFSVGTITASRDGNATAVLNRKTSDGDIVQFRKDGTTVGSIGVDSNDQLYISRTAGSQGIKFKNGGAIPCNADGSDSDNDQDLGIALVRWDDIYATNGTIQTSDRNEKQDIEELTDAEQRVAIACKGLLRKFRWKDAVEEKGDAARIHFGIIAQDLQDAFAAEGLDAGRYAMFISSTWWETQTEVPAVEAVDEVLDEDGNVVTEAVEAKEAYTRTDTYETLEEAPEGATERTRLGVRYPELLAFIIAAI